MKRHSPVCTLFLCLIAFTFSTLSHAQANINEGLESAFYWVNGTTGNDNNNGSESAPFKTINKAVSVAIANNQAGIGSQVNIESGTYRETVTMNGSSSNTTLPITFQAVTNGTVIIDGATVLKGWTVYSGNNKIYQTNWAYNFPTCPAIPGCPVAQSIVLQQELLSVNGTVMTQVLSIAELEPGSFYVDQAASLVYLYPASSVNIATATIETATSPTLWALQGESYIVLRGLTFEHANTCRSSAAVSVSGTSSNILLDTDTIEWNNGQGLGIVNPVTNFTVQNTISNHNGDSGFQAYQTLDGLWTNDTANFNNWRGAQGGYYACNVGGYHSFQAHDDALNGVTYAYNQSYGIHYDTDNQNDTANNLTSTNNIISSVFSEKNEGPITITASNLCNSSVLQEGAGLAIRNSTDVSISGSNIYNNNPAQIDVFGQAGGIKVTNWQTGQQYNLITSAFTNTSNVIEGVGSSQQVFQDTLGGTDWATFILNFDSNKNTWWNASNSTTEFEVPSPSLDTLLSFAAWQTALGQDLLSTFAAPSGNPGAVCAKVVPDKPDYWFTIDNTALTLNAAGQATYNLTATPLTLSGTVTLLLDGLQGIAGMSSAFSPASLSLTGGNAATSALTITDTTATPPGTYPITMVANTGNLTKMVTAQLTVPPLGFRLNTLLLAFGNQQVNTQSAGLSVTLTNNGSKAESITSVVATPSVFTQTNTCGKSLAAGASCTATVKFKPTSPGVYSGTLTFTDADATSPQVVTLTGTGTAAPTATLLPASLNLGAVVVGVTSAAKTSTLTNTSTTSSLNITSITITGTDASDFKTTSATTCPSSGTLAPLATCVISVDFTPGAAGSRSATLTVADNTSTGKQTIALSGTGTADTATATLIPAALNFGSVAVGATSAAKTSTLTDTSATVALNITSIALSGADAGDFTITSATTCPSSGSVNPLGTCLVSVTFSPKASGARSATLTVTDNTSSGKNTIGLSGTGTN